MFRLFCLAAAGVALTMQGAERWRYPEMPWRRRLLVEADADRSPGTARTVVFLPTNGGGEPLSCLLLVDRRGRGRPLSVLHREGSRADLFFTASGGEELWLYIGDGAVSGLSAKQHSGLVHRVRTYSGGAVGTAAEFNRLWGAGTDVGGRFVDRVFSSFNPFGADAGSLHRYDGFLQIDTPGAYAFCIASTDASFLFIDGAPVVSWPGLHDVRGGLGGDRRGTVTLAVGTHAFAFLHANSRADQCYAIAAFVPPGASRHEVIPPRQFTPVRYARVGRLEARTGEAVVDFTWEPEPQISIDKHYLLPVRFELAGAANAPAAWDFGDGTRGKGAAISHCYFRPGAYAATVGVGAGGDKQRLRQLVVVAPRRLLDEHDDGRAVQRLRRAVRQEAAGGIQAAGYATVVRHAMFYQQPALACRFAPRVVANAARVADADVFPVFMKLALATQEEGERYDLSQACFRILLARVTDPGLRARAALHNGGMLDLCLNHPTEARAVLAKIRADDLADPRERRLLAIYLADTALVLDGVATARRDYEAITRTRPLIIDGELDRIRLTQENARYFRIRNILAQGLFRQALEEIDILEWETPTERLNPLTNLLKMAALVGNRQPRKAAVCLERALLAEVDERYRTRIRLHLAELYFDLGQLIRARRQIRLIKEESPYSREEIEAERLGTRIDARLDAAAATAE